MAEPMRHPLPHLARFDWPGLAEAVQTHRYPRSHSSVAPEIGISTAAVRRAEAGQSVSLRSYARLCGWLGVSMDRFAGVTADG